MKEKKCFYNSLVIMNVKNIFKKSSFKEFYCTNFAGEKMFR